MARSGAMPLVMRPPAASGATVRKSRRFIRASQARILSRSARSTRRAYTSEMHDDRPAALANISRRRMLHALSVGGAGMALAARAPNAAAALGWLSCFRNRCFRPPRSVGWRCIFRRLAAGGQDGFTAIRYRCVRLRMKIERWATAIEASVAPSSSLTASRLYVVPGAMTVATPSSLRK